MKSSTLITSFLAFSCVISHAALVWTVGVDDSGLGNPWPIDGVGGGAAADFLQENGSINSLPGSATSGTTPSSSDNDYYFAGSYTTALAGNVSSYGSYSPIGTIATDETGWERAFAAADNDLRVHFNLGSGFGPNDLAVITFDASNLHDGQPDTRYGIEVWFNGVKVRNEEIIRAPQLDVDFATTAFTLASVGAVTGPGADNIVSLRGINYNGSGGGNWMGIDYVQLDITPAAVPEPSGAMLLGGLVAAGLLRRRRLAVV